MRAVVVALAVNLAIAVAKFVAFLFTGSASMLAEAVHSVADTGNELLLLIGRGRSRRGPTLEHPFGYGRERYFYSFIVAVMLFTVGAAFSIYDGVHKIMSPEHVDSAAVAFVVLAVSAVLEAFSLRTTIQEANKIRGGVGWLEFVHSTKSAELPVVLMEDLAALTGLCFAFFGILLSVLTGDGVWDGVGSVLVGLLLGCAAFIVGYESKSLLIGESANSEVSASIVSALESGSEGFRVIHLRTTHVSPESLLVTAKIAVPPTMTAADLVDGIDAAEARIRQKVPIAETIYLEPDIYRPGQENVADPSIEVVRRSRRLRPRPRLPRRSSSASSAPGASSTSAAPSSPPPESSPASSSPAYPSAVQPPPPRDAARPAD